VQPMKTCVFLPKVNYFVTHRAQNFTSATTPKLHDANRRAAPPLPHLPHACTVLITFSVEHGLDQLGCLSR
jgi:hypothetical protein